MTLLGWFVAAMVLKGLGLLALGFAVHRVLRWVPAAPGISVWHIVFVCLLALPVGMGVLPGWEVIPSPAGAWVNELFRGGSPPAGTTQGGADLGNEGSLYLSWDEGSGHPRQHSLTDSGGDPSSQLSQATGVQSVLLGSWKDPLAGLFVIWLAGVLVLLGRSGVALARLAGLRRRAQRITDPATMSELKRAGRAVAAQVDRVALLTTGELEVPVTWGIRHPVVVLPRRMLGAPSPVLQSVLRHELVHVRRRSWAFQWLCRGACILHWCNPWSWRAARALAVAEEEEVDRAVVASGIPASSYVEHLLEAVRALRASSGGAFPAAALGTADGLEARIRLLLAGTHRRGEVHARSSLLVLSLFMGTAAAVACADLRPPPDPVPGMPTGISERPVLEVGVREGVPDQEFHEVVTPFRMPDGRLVVPQRGSGEIRIFRSDGGLALRLGGQGEGPGEFLSLSQAWARGDTVEAFDGNLGRVTRFHPDGSVQVVTLERLPGVQGAVPDPVPGGWLTVGVASGAVGARDEVVIHGFDLQGGHLGEVARLPAMERTTYPGGGTGPAPLTPRAQVQARGDRIFLGETLTPGIRVLSLSGGEETHFSWEAPSTLEPAEALARLREAAEGQLGPDGDPMSQLLQAALDVPAPTRISSFWSLLVDPYGFLWVRDYDPALHGVGVGGLESPSGYLMGGSGPGGNWRVFSPEGEEVGRVSVPPDLELIRVEGDGVVGIHRDALGVESVRVHDLVRQ